MKQAREPGENVLDSGAPDALALPAVIRAIIIDAIIITRPPGPGILA